MSDSWDKSENGTKRNGRNTYKVMPVCVGMLSDVLHQVSIGHPL